MIEFLIFSILPCLVAALAMVVLRAGASQVFFDVVGTFQAGRLIADAEAKVTVLQSLMLDGLSGIQDSAAALSQQMTAVTDATVPLSREIQEARLEFEKFANFAGGDEVAGAIMEIGLASGFAADQALMAGARMAQLSAIVGGGAGVASATQSGIEFGLIGGMGTEDAMKRMISLQQQTNYMYGELTDTQLNRLTAEEKANLVRTNSIRLMDELNTIENRSAATMSQITYVMNQFASSAKLAGDSTSFMAAMAATLIEAGEEQGKAGRSLRMMYARLGADTGGSTAQLKHYGIAVKDATGNMRSMEDIFGDIAARSNNMTKAQKMELAQAIAGNDHYVRALKLMDNYGRAQQLSAEGAARLDTAQDELNRRYEDQAFQLTQVEAKLKNANASLGNHFVPGVIFATNVMANLSGAMGDMGEESELVGRLLSVGAGLNEFGKIFAPIVEANLNMMSLNVSLKAQKAITRAINGEEIVRSSAYGQKKNDAIMSMNMLESELAAQDRMNNALILGMQMKKEGLTIAQQMQVLESGQIVDLDVIQAKEQQILARLKEAVIEKQKAHQFDLANKPSFVGKNQKGIYEDLRQQHSMRLLMNDDQVFLNHLEKQGLTGQYERNKIITNNGQLAKNFLNRKGVELEFERALAGHEEKKASAMKSLMTMKNAINNADARDVAKSGEKVQQIEKELLIMKQLKAEKGQSILLSQQAKTAFTGESVTEQILRDAHVKSTSALMAKTNAQSQNKIVTDALGDAAHLLSAELGLEAQAIMELLVLMPAFTNVMKGVEAQNKALVTTSMASNMSMMKTSAILGGLSMAFGLMSENEDLAKVSAILMTASMVPATIQMMSMTTATMGLAGATGAADVATKKLTLSQKLLSKSSLAMIALLAVVGTFVWATKDNYNDASDAALNFAEVVSYSADQYAETERRMMGKDLVSISQDLLATSNLVLETEEQLAKATDETNRKVLMARLEIYKMEESAIRDIMNLESARAIQNDAITAQEVFDMGQKLKIARDAEADAKNEDGYIYSWWNGDRARKTLGRDDSKLQMKDALDFMGIKIGQEAYVESKSADTAKALSAIPQEYQGAIADLAAASTDFEDFMNKISVFAEESGSDFGAIFGQMGEDIKEDFIGPIEAAKEAIFEFNNDREEMFFGMAKGNLTGDMVKQVVNRGVETLINTTEVIMTNTFQGMTTSSAAHEITSQIMKNLRQNGLNVSNGSIAL